MNESTFTSAVPTSPAAHSSSGAASMARWVDDMVQRELTEPFDLGEARLYVIPAGQSQTAVLLDRDANPYRLLERTTDHSSVTAAALVVTGWCAPTDSPDASTMRPSEHPFRQRVRITVAIDHTGIATVMRRDGAPNEPDLMEDRGEGELPDALERWWCGTSA